MKAGSSVQLSERHSAQLTFPLGILFAFIFCLFSDLFFLSLSFLQISGVPPPPLALFSVLCPLHSQLHLFINTYCSSPYWCLVTLTSSSTTYCSSPASFLKSLLPSFLSSWALLVSPWPPCLQALRSICPLPIVHPVT